MAWAPFPPDPSSDGPASDGLASGSIGGGRTGGGRIGGGTTGSEDGTILIDEDYDGCARITLERGGRSAPFAITCGIYGWMVHTRFFGEEAGARADYEAMKAALGAIVEAIPLRADPECAAKSAEVTRAISDFVDDYP